MWEYGHLHLISPPMRSVSTASAQIPHPPLSASTHACSSSHTLALIDLVCALPLQWVKGRDNFYDLAALLTHPIIQQMIKQAPVAAAAAAAGQAPASSSAASPSGSGESQTSSGNPSHAGDSSSSSSAQGPAQEVQRQQEQGGQRPVRVGLVFGREELGMSDEEVDACTLVCSIPIGRLQVGPWTCGGLRICIGVWWMVSQPGRLGGLSNLGAGNLPAIPRQLGLRRLHAGLLSSQVPCCYLSAALTTLLLVTSPALWLPTCCPRSR